MKKRTVYTSLAVLLTGGLFQPADAQQKAAINITTSAVPFLRISPDARSGGMGDAGIALLPDANSCFYNTAKTVFAQAKTGVALNYAPWLKEVADDMYMATLAGFHRPDEEQAITASLRYFNLGSVAVIDYSGTKLQTARPREFAVDLGYARKLSRLFSLGVTLRYINSALAAGAVNGNQYKTGNAVAADLSLFYHGIKDNGSGWTAGLSISNLGSKVGYTNEADKKDFLPANLGIGAAYKESWDEQHSFTITTEFNKSLVPKLPEDADENAIADYRKKGVVESWFNSFGNNAWQLGFGAEYAYRNRLFLRAGYNSQTYSQGNWQYITTGFGLQYSIATLHFSYLIPTGDKVSRNPLANTVRLGIAFGLAR